MVLKDNPYAYYVHCFAHRLQLVLIAAAREVTPVEQFFTRLSIIVNLVSSSSKRHDELQDAQQEELANRIASKDGIQTGRGLNQRQTLQRAADTRWSSYKNSVDSLIDLFVPTGAVLETIIKEGTSEQRGQADAMYDRLHSFDFIFILHLMRELFGKTDNLCQILQRRNQDVVTAMSQVSTTKVLLQTFRDSGWDDLFSKVKAFCEKHDVEIPDMSAHFRGSQGQSRRHNLSAEHYYKKEVLFQATDALLLEMNHRFDDRVVDLLTLSGALNPRLSFKNFKRDQICDLMRKYYSEDFSTQEQYQLEYELQHFELDVCQSMKKLKSLSELCAKLVETGKHAAYPLVYRLICLVLTLPVSTATCERAFSAMNLVKTRLRSKMEDEFLRDTLVIYIEKEISSTYSTDAVIHDFLQVKNRRIKEVIEEEKTDMTEAESPIEETK